MIIIQDLRKDFKLPNKTIEAIKDINLEVQQGEIFGVIGTSGAGKSTLIRCLNGLETPTHGKVIIDGQDITTLSTTKLRALRSKIGMIFQGFNLMQSKTVWQNIALPLEIMHWTKKDIRARVDELLLLTDLKAFTYHYPNQLSGGQKQRVAIARALANHPSLLLCDEATSALDPDATHSILQLLKNINKQLNLTIFLITHEMDVVKSICDRVAVIHDGAVVEQNKAIKVFTRPEHRITQNFVNHAFALDIPPNIKPFVSQVPTKTSSTLIQISYHGDVADQPIISSLQQAYHIHTNILQGKIETVQNQTLGQLLVEIQGEQTAQVSSIDFLKKNGLTVKTLGYVHRDNNSAV